MRRRQEGVGLELAQDLDLQVATKIEVAIAGCLAAKPLNSSPMTKGAGAARQPTRSERPGWAVGIVAARCNAPNGAGRP